MAAPGDAAAQVDREAWGVVEMAVEALAEAVPEVEGQEVEGQVVEAEVGRGAPPRRGLPAAQRLPGLRLVMPVAKGVAGA